MNDKLQEYVDGVFAPYEGAKSVGELKADLLADLRERFRELRAEGKDDASAFELTIDSIGDIEQTVHEVANLSRLLERRMMTRFDESDLAGSDLTHVAARNGKFERSALRGSDFSHSDLTGSSFKNSDLTDADFDGADLTDVTMTSTELTRASFHEATLVRTDFSTSGLIETRFVDAALTDVRLRNTDLRHTVFQGCTFTGVDFSGSDLRGLKLDASTFVSVNFEKTALENVSFRRATLRDVSFRALTKKYRAAIRTVNFEGALMDKLTYAGLTGLGADLSAATIT
ncbi:pentapeptide repeat-containing protein [Nocardia sp. NPDC060256]|uniref:pentapeptide repeat-containing protein n=1 Tax=unclassified Nocardia TaxID=2637762 RepID=UPI00365E151D